MLIVLCIVVTLTHCVGVSIGELLCVTFDETSPAGRCIGVEGTVCLSVAFSFLS